jgi:DNA-binding transcriptional LysR family regulator
MSATFVHDERVSADPHAGHVRLDADCETARRRRSRRAACATLNLNALLVFAKVAESSSFSEGARRLRIPVSTASRQVAELEAQLGVRLLERSTRSIRLTGIGVEVLAEARVAVSMKESIQGLVSSRLSSISGLLKISVPSSIANALMMPIVGSFQASYPDVRVHMIISDRTAGDLSTSDFDLLVKTGPLKDSSRISRKILSFRDCLLASPAYLKTREAPETPNELLDHRLLALFHCEPEIKWSFVHKDQSGNRALSDSQ